MGVKVRERPKGSGVWWVVIDHHGKRKSKKIGKDKRLANDAAKKIEAKLTLGDLDLLDSEDLQIPFQQYATQWLEGYGGAALKHSTYRGYKSILKRHLLPEFKNTPLQGVKRERIKNFLFKKINEGLAPARVKHIKAVLSGIFTQAVEDGHLDSNPASKLGKFLNSKDQMLGKEISPLTAEELDVYLETCSKHYPAYHPFFLTLARTGMRLGEALGLQWGDINFSEGFMEIRRALVDNRVTTPKNGKTRRVDMTPQLVECLRDLCRSRKEETLKNGWREVPEWVFVNGDGKPLDQGNVRGRIHYKICEKAGLHRIRIHDLRHSYATLRLSCGHNLPDVSKQLGHSSINITVDTYYHWIPNQKKTEVAELDQLGKSATIRNLSATTSNTNDKGVSQNAG